jgi:hypothetical protein
MERVRFESRLCIFNSHTGVGVQTGSTRHVGHFWPIVPAPGDCEDGEFGGMKISRGNRSTRRKPAPGPLCPPIIPGRRGGKPATNRLSYGAAISAMLLTIPSFSWLSRVPEGKYRDSTSNQTTTHCFHVSNSILVSRQTRIDDVRFWRRIM